MPAANSTTATARAKRVYSLKLAAAYGRNRGQALLRQVDAYNAGEPCSGNYVPDDWQ